MTKVKINWHRLLDEFYISCIGGHMKQKIRKRYIIIFIFVLCLTSITIIFTSNVNARKNYIPIATNIGDQSALSQTSNNQYQINARGDRFGSAKFIDIGMLDLVLAKGTNGEIGYVRVTDLDEPIPQSPEEAANWRTTDRYINLYAEDGITVIGKFLINENSD